MKDFYVDHKGDFDLKCFVIYFTARKYLDVCNVTQLEKDTVLVSYDSKLSREDNFWLYQVSI